MSGVTHEDRLRGGLVGDVRRRRAGDARSLVLQRSRPVARFAGTADAAPRAGQTSGNVTGAIHADP
jgi:hypothetical protein